MIEGLTGSPDGGVDKASEEAALAVGGEAAVELETTAPGEGPGVAGAVEVVEPISEAERDELRGRQAFQVGINYSNLIPGPDGRQMISGHNR